MKKIRVQTENAPSAIGPYSQAVDLGCAVFTSGQIPVDPATGEIAGDVKAQTAQCLNNVKAVLEAAGTGMDRVIKTTVFLSDLGKFTQMNEVYSTFFSEPYPARSCVEAARLPRDVLVEIEAIALK